MSELWTPGKTGELVTRKGSMRVGGVVIKYCLAEPAFSSSFNTDAIPVLFEHGVGEIGYQQVAIIKYLAQELGCRVVGYNSDLIAAGKKVGPESVNHQREVYLRVVDATGLGGQPHDVIAHSLGGLTTAAGSLANIGDSEDNGHQHTRVGVVTLLAPATLTPETYLSNFWLDRSRELDLVGRVTSFRAYETDWKKHGRLLAKMFSKTLMKELRNGYKDPQTAIAGINIAREMRMISRLPDAFAVLANISTVPEIINAAKNGVKINLAGGSDDQLFPLATIEEAIRMGIPEIEDVTRPGIAEIKLLKAKISVVEIVLAGHSSLATNVGKEQLKALVLVHRGIPEGIYISSGSTKSNAWRTVPTN
ncbi:hypothetical protein KA531_02500 [Candidatus Saccharibacteria bacterium]|nr:hypothetical protein [Candidatus Saccharibacteria bacterium]